MAKSHPGPQGVEYALPGGPKLQGIEQNFKKVRTLRAICDLRVRPQLQKDSVNWEKIRWWTARILPKRPSSCTKLKARPPNFELAVPSVSLGEASKHWNADKTSPKTKQYYFWYRESEPAPAGSSKARRADSGCGSTRLLKQSRFTLWLGDPRKKVASSH